MIRRLLPVLLTLVLFPVELMAADPFRSGTGPSAAGQVLAQTEVGWLGGLIGEIAKLQRGLNEAISTHLRDLATTGSTAALWGVLGVAFLYGVFHAAGPGHGKTVVAAYFVARKETVRRGIGIAAAISFLQAIVAVALVGALGIVFNWGGIDVANSTTPIETVSYGLIVALGLWLLWQAVTGRHHHHHHHPEPAAAADHHHDHDHGHGACGHGYHHHHEKPRSALGIVVGAGLTPCASAIIIMLFALAQQVFWVGVVATLVMAVGMALTVSAIGVATIYARRLVARFAGAEENQTVERLLGGLGAVALIVFAGLMLLGANARLPG